MYARSGGFGESVYLHRLLCICIGSLKSLRRLEIAVSNVLPGLKWPPLFFSLSNFIPYLDEVDVN